MDRLPPEGELADLDHEHDCPAIEVVLPVELCEQPKQIPHHNCTDVSASGWSRAKQLERFAAIAITTTTTTPTSNVQLIPRKKENGG